MILRVRPNRARGPVALGQDQQGFRNGTRTKGRTGPGILAGDVTPLSRSGPRRRGAISTSTSTELPTKRGRAAVLTIDCCARREAARGVFEWFASLAGAQAGVFLSVGRGSVSFRAIRGPVLRARFCSHFHTLTKADRRRQPRQRASRRKPPAESGAWRRRDEEACVQRNA